MLAPPAAAQVPSPLKKVEESAVPDPSLAVPTVPDERLLAFNEVKFAPETAPKLPHHVPLVTVPVVVKLELPAKGLAPTVL